MSPDLVPGGAKAVTPSDTATFTPPLVGLIVGGAGNVAITDAYGNTSTLAAAVGKPLMVRAAKIMATGTTATSVVGFVA